MIEWKVIEECPCYSVSNEGQVRNDRTGHILKPSNNKQRFDLTQNGKRLGNPTLYRLMGKYWKFEWIKELDDDEECKPMIGHPDYYITNKARVYSLTSRKWLAPHNTNHYYHCVVLEEKCKSLSREVGRHFLSDFEEELDVLHENEKLPYPEIHYAGNLWMGTKSENTQDMITKGRAGWQQG